MKYFAYVWIDIKRLLRSKATWAVVAAVALSPLLTLLTGLSGSASATTLTSRYVSQPAMSGAMYSMFLFVLFSLYEISRVQRRNIGSITDSVVSPLVLGSAKVLALAVVSALAAALAFLVNLPFAAAQMKVMFDFSVYCQFYFIIFWPTLLFGLLLIAACFQIFYRAELSIALFILAFYFTKVNPWTPYNFLIDWTWPAVEFMSDTFNGFHLMRTAIYNRLVWLAVFAGAYLFSLLFTRRYQKGFAASFCVNAKRVYQPALAAVLIAAGCLLFAHQPFLDKSDSSQAGLPQTFNSIMMEDLTCDVVCNLKSGTLSGRMQGRISNRETEPKEYLIGLNPGYRVTSLTVDGEEIPFSDPDQIISNMRIISYELPARADMELAIAYEGYPQMYNLDSADSLPHPLIVYSSDIITEGYVSLSQQAIAPYTDIPALGMRGTVTVPSYMQIIVDDATDTGLIVSPAENGDTTTWSISEMRNRGIIFTDFKTRRADIGNGKQVEIYYGAKNDEMMDRIGIEKIISDAHRYCTALYGEDVTLKGRDLKIIQRNSFMWGNWALGVINLSEEELTEDYLYNNPLLGASPQEIFARKIAYNWWSGGVFLDYRSEIPWSYDGFVNYTIYRMAKDTYGEAYAQENYVDVWERDVELSQRNFYRRHPEYLEKLPESARSIVSGQLQYSDLSSRMALMLLDIEQRVGGEEAFTRILRDFYQDKAYTAVREQVKSTEFLTYCGLTLDDMAAYR